MSDNSYIFILMLMPIAAIVFFACVASFFGKKSFSTLVEALKEPQPVRYFDSFKLKNRGRRLCLFHFIRVQEANTLTIISNKNALNVKK